MTWKQVPCETLGWILEEKKITARELHCGKIGSNDYEMDCIKAR
jgi:hypothetical protein